MNERLIQNALYDFWRLKGHQLMCPNYTPLNWWECDMFSLTKAGRFYECEIKISKADFKADSKKASRDRFLFDPDAKTWDKRPGANKHDLLTLGDVNGPSRFYYVTPEGLISPGEVPEFAGLIHVRPATFNGARVIKEAPRLHTQKCHDRVIDHCRGVFFWRFWSLRNQRSMSVKQAAENTQQGQV